MSAERDELTDEIAGHPIGSGYYSTSVGIDEAREIADVILAAGYRKPRTITTVEELEEIHRGTLVLASNGEVWRKYTHKWDNLDETGGLLYPPHHIGLPVTLLHEGSAA